MQKMDPNESLTLIFGDPLQRDEQRNIDQPFTALFSKGLASYCKAESTFTFHFSILTLSNTFLGIDNREMKSESGFSFAIASQPFE